MSKVLVLATSRKTRGGVTSVVMAHERGLQWNTYHCKWIETHRDGNIAVKFIYCVFAFFNYLVDLPFCDIVHVHVGESPSACRKAIFVLFARLFHKKIIVHFHSFSPDTTIRGNYSKVYGYLFANADRVVVLSNYWENEVLHVFPNVRTSVIYNPCLRKTANDCVMMHNEEKYILFAGTLSERKGYNDLLQAFANLEPKYDNWRLVFAGNDVTGKALELVNQLKLENRVSFLGWVSGEAKDKAFKNASIYCLPSYAEGFSMGVLDAWAYGIPVVTTPVGGIVDVGVDEENLLFVNPGDIKILSEKLSLLIGSEDLQHKLVKNASKLVREIFDEQRINEYIGKLYAEVLSE